MKFILTTILSIASICLSMAQVKVAPGDTLSIIIKGVPQEEQSSVSGKYEVNAAGRIKLPHLDNMLSASGSTSTVARRIESAYKTAQIYTTPTITVKSLRAEDAEQKNIQKFVTVTGQVGRSGPVLHRPGMTINEVVATAAPNTFAAKNRVELQRNGKVYKYDLENPQHRMLKVYPNDQINVPQQNWRGR